MASRPRAAARPRFLVILAVVAVAAGLAGPAGAAGPPGYKTAQAPMLTAVIPRAWVDPIITVGDTIGSYKFEALPDGVVVRKGAKGGVEVYVNHETSTVPFPYSNDPNAVPPTSPNQGNSQNDFDNAQLSRLVVDRKDATIDSASMVITSAEGYQRFCSSYLGTKAAGFERELLLTNEEAVDWVNRTPPSWPAVEGADNARQSGVVVAHDPKTGETRPIWGMGRLNHENSLAVPGYKKPVVVTGDDTFVNNPSQSQMYTYIAADADAVWNDTGDLWAFVSDGTQQKYEDFHPTDPPGTSTWGHFIKVPKLIVTGRNPDGSDVMAADAEAHFGTPGAYAVPTNGSFSRPPGKTTGPSVDGPQWVLERWSQINHVFSFVRLEDMAYDKRPGMSNVLYVLDSGRGLAGPADGRSTNGRVFKMVLDKKDPTKVTSLSVFIEGDDNPVKTPGEIHQPDNIESTKNGLYITEDPGSQQQFNFTDQLNDSRRTEARIMQYRFATGAVSVAFKIDQSADEGTTDVDTTGRGNLGAWEASGIIDVSHWFGKGTFLVTVQAHSLFIETGPGLDVAGDSNADILNKREGGQLLLVHIPGGADGPIRPQLRRPRPSGGAFACPGRPIALRLVSRGATVTRACDSSSGLPFRTIIALTWLAGLWHDARVPVPRCATTVPWSAPPDLRTRTLMATEPAASPTPALRRETQSALYERALRAMPGGTDSNFRAWGKDTVYVDRGKGGMVWDLDGNEYIDLRMGYGPVLLGHGDDRVDDYVNERMRRGVSFSLTSEDEIRAMELVKELTGWVDKARMTVSGTEATMHAMRIARAFTGRDKIVKFEGQYHGVHDYALISVSPDDMSELGDPDAPVRLAWGRGIPDAVADTIIPARYNRIEALRALFEDRGEEIAAIIVEPVLGNAQGIMPKAGFHQAMRALTEEFGILLIFDEVKTGFRFARGGAAEYFGIKPDLATYAKAMGNGYPAAAFGGREEVMSVLPDKVSHGGTYAGNRVAAAAAVKTLEILRDTDAIETVHAIGQRVQDGLREVLNPTGLPYHFTGHPSMFGIMFSEVEASEYRDWALTDHELYDAIALGMHARGAMPEPDSREPWFFCEAHAQGDIVDRVVSIFSDSLDAALEARAHGASAGHLGSAAHPSGD